MNAQASYQTKPQMLEQTRYNDIMRSINNTEQFIKAKQAIAAQEKMGKQVVNRNNRKQMQMTDVPQLNSTNSGTSSLLQTQYTATKPELSINGQQHILPAAKMNISENKKSSLDKHGKAKSKNQNPSPLDKEDIMYISK